MLVNKSKHGAVYQVGTEEDLPSSHRPKLLQSRPTIGSSPPVKRKRVTSEVAVSSTTVLQLNFERSLQREGEVEVEEEEKDDFQGLLDELTPDSPPQEQMEEIPPEEEPTRPHRERRQTLLYQSDEVALLDKRVVKE